ncbi:hypothetical protein EVAR_94836_1 [Eumeta japonica]|uniref:Uncharacterized protein n=1 Tax=Eumeta variegata TaxID=151549 RepID=A0A4C1UIP9_EUMVA|nr:hypothetical protein EVAR_94836_1 [Eumeta japonica]
MNRLWRRALHNLFISDRWAWTLSPPRWPLQLELFVSDRRRQHDDEGRYQLLNVISEQLKRGSEMRTVSAKKVKTVSLIRGRIDRGEAQLCLDASGGNIICYDQQRPRYENCFQHE